MTELYELEVHSEWAPELLLTSNMKRISILNEPKQTFKLKSLPKYEKCNINEELASSGTSIKLSPNGKYMCVVHPQALLIFCVDDNYSSPILGIFSEQNLLNIEWTKDSNYITFIGNDTDLHLVSIYGQHLLHTRLITNNNENLLITNFDLMVDQYQILVLTVGGLLFTFQLLIEEKTIKEKKVNDLDFKINNLICSPLIVSSYHHTISHFCYCNLNCLLFIRGCDIESKPNFSIWRLLETEKGKKNEKEKDKSNFACIHCTHQDLKRSRFEFFSKLFSNLNQNDSEPNTITPQIIHSPNYEFICLLTEEGKVYLFQCKNLKTSFAPDIEFFDLFTIENLSKSNNDNETNRKKRTGIIKYVTWINEETLGFQISSKSEKIIIFSIKTKQIIKKIPLSINSNLNFQKEQEKKSTIILDNFFTQKNIIPIFEMNKSDQIWRISTLKKIQPKIVLERNIRNQDFDNELALEFCSKHNIPRSYFYKVIWEINMQKKINLLKEEKLNNPNNSNDVNNNKKEKENENENENENELKKEENDNEKEFFEKGNINKKKSSVDQLPKKLIEKIIKNVTDIHWIYEQCTTRVSSKKNTMKNFFELTKKKINEMKIEYENENENENKNENINENENENENDQQKENDKEKEKEKEKENENKKNDRLDEIEEFNHLYEEIYKICKKFQVFCEMISIDSKLKYSAIGFTKFRDTSILDLCLNYSKKMEFSKLYLMFKNYSDELKTNFTQILDEIPETIEINKYRDLLKFLDPNDEQNFDWFLKKSIEIDNNVGMLNNSLNLLSIGMELGINKLKSYFEQLSQLNILVYDYDYEELTFESWLNNITKQEKRELILDNSKQKNLIRDLKIFKPLIEESIGELFQFMINWSKNPKYLQKVNLVISHSSLTLERGLRIIQNDEQLFDITLKCIYNVEDYNRECKDLITILNLFKHDYNENLSKEKSLKLNLFFIHLQTIEILNAFGIKKNLKYFKKHFANKIDSQIQKETAKELISTLVQIPIELNPDTMSNKNNIKNPKRYSRKQWDQLFENLKKLQENLFKNLISKDEIYKYFLKSLLSSAEFILADGYLKKKIILSKYQIKKIILNVSIHFFNLAKTFDDKKLDFSQICINILLNKNLYEDNDKETDKQTGRKNGKEEKLVELINEQKNLIKAIQILHEAFGFVKLLPITVRQHEKKLELIKNIVSKLKSVKQKRSEVLELSKLLALTKIEDQVRVKKFFIERACSLGSYHLASKMCLNLSKHKFSFIWQLYFQIIDESKNKLRINLKIDLITNLLTYCDDIQFINKGLSILKLLELESKSKIKFENPIEISNEKLIIKEYIENVWLDFNFLKNNLNDTTSSNSKSSSIPSSTMAKSSTTAQSDLTMKTSTKQNILNLNINKKIPISSSMELLSIIIDYYHLDHQINVNQVFEYICLNALEEDLSLGFSLLFIPKEIETSLNLLDSIIYNENINLKKTNQLLNFGKKFCYINSILLLNLNTQRITDYFLINNIKLKNIVIQEFNNQIKKNLLNENLKFRIEKFLNKINKYDNYENDLIKCKKVLKFAPIKLNLKIKKFATIQRYRTKLLLEISRDIEKIHFDDFMSFTSQWGLQNKILLIFLETAFLSSHSKFSSSSLAKFIQKWNDKLLEDPIQTKEMLSNVFSKIKGTSHKRLNLYFGLLLTCEKHVLSKLNMNDHIDGNKKENMNTEREDEKMEEDGDEKKLEKEREDTKKGQESIKIETEKEKEKENDQNQDQEKKIQFLKNEIHKLEIHVFVLKRLGKLVSGHDYKNLIVDPEYEIQKVINIQNLKTFNSLLSKINIITEIEISKSWVIRLLISKMLTESTAKSTQLSSYNACKKYIPRLDCKQLYLLIKNITIGPKMDILVVEIKKSLLNYGINKLSNNSTQSEEFTDWVKELKQIQESLN
ncbi:neuroblastoma-amplified sequence [Anaeramoeba flamelloides]|uniref:Neuroblastoma-amplified sequence n=1 Tax=Anaeramoeba flamelloides TaxID=1746091 RepID=A0AAV7Z576_9EUKA|nr:neuroblastoma-amplified sequence [Anaeramoeba flamelloides]